MPWNEEKRLLLNSSLTLWPDSLAMDMKRSRLTRPKCLREKSFKGIVNAQRNVSNGIFLIEFYPSRVGSRAPSSRSSFACDKNIQYVRFDQLRHACSHVRSHSHHFGLNSSYDCENEPSQQKAGWGSRLCKYSLLLSQDQELLILSRWGFSATEPGQGGDQPLASTVFMITLVNSMRLWSNS